MPSVYVVLEPDPIVARDLVELIIDHRPDADVRITTSMAETEGLAASLEAISAMILQDGASGVSVTDLPQDIAAVTGRIVVLHDRGAGRSSADDAKTRFVRQPFTTEMILQALEGGPG